MIKSQMTQSERQQVEADLAQYYATDGRALAMENIKIERLSNRSLSRVYDVFTQHDHLVMKYLHPSRSLSDQYNEIDAQQQMANFMSTPPIWFHARWADDQAYVFIQPYLQHQSVSLSDMVDVNILSRVLNTVKKLHTAPVKFKKTLQPVALAQNYLQMAKRHQFADERIIDQINRGIALFSAFTSSSVAPCHLDLNLHNILLSQAGTSLTLIDWECAANSDPWYDLACLFFYTNFPKKAVSEVLADYDSDANQPLSLAKIDLYRTLCLLIMASWLAYMLAIQGRKPHAVAAAHEPVGAVIPHYIYQTADSYIDENSLLQWVLHEFTATIHSPTWHQTLGCVIEGHDG